MRAIICTAYGAPEVLELQEVETPAPSENQVRICVHAAGVTKGDCELRGLTLPGFARVPMRLYMGWSKPTRVRILGMELSGVVDAVGEGVTRFKVGDAVMAATDTTFGAYAEYVCVAETGPVTHMPANLDFAEAAVLPLGGLDAYHFMRKAGVQRGEHVLVNGAAGTIGHFAVQIAKMMGAEVTAVDSGDKFEMLRSIGADHVIDYRQQDFTRGGLQYDVVMDVVGSLSYDGGLGVLRSGGRLVLANPSATSFARAPISSATGDKKVITTTAGHTAADLEMLREWVEAGKLRPVVDRRFALEEMVEAHHYVESGKKRGEVVAMVIQDPAGPEPGGKA
jgi:NADPH:quinone reductase-like Zn-dependent oxidoreductase